MPADTDRNPDPEPSETPASEAKAAAVATRPEAPSSDSQNAKPNLAIELTGDLPCVSCRYNLRGLSVRATCPECGAPVGVTILARVDPMAAELKPIATPRVAAVGLVIWPASAAAAAVTVWVMHGMHTIGDLIGASIVWTPSLVIASTIAIALSAVGALIIGLSAAGLRDAASGRAISVGALYLPLLALHWWIHTNVDPPNVPVYPPGLGESLRPTLHIAMTAISIAILLGMRKTYRAIVARSRLMRSGKVGRQELMPLAVTQLLVIAGDVALYIGAGMDDTTGGALRFAGTFMVGLGSLLLTIGLFALIVDAFRLTPYVGKRVLGPRDVLPEPGKRAHRAGGADGE